MDTDEASRLTSVATSKGGAPTRTVARRENEAEGMRLLVRAAIASACSRRALSELSRASPGASDGDLLSLDDCETGSVFSEFREDQRDNLDAKDESRTPCYRPTLTLETSSAVLNEREPVFPVVEGAESQYADSQMPRQAAESVPEYHTQVPRAEQPPQHTQPSAVPDVRREDDHGSGSTADIESGDRVLIITDSAHKTYAVDFLIPVGIPNEYPTS